MDSSSGHRNVPRHPIPNLTRARSATPGLLHRRERHMPRPQRDALGRIVIGAKTQSGCAHRISFSGAHRCTRAATMSRPVTAPKPVLLRAETGVLATSRHGTNSMRPHGPPDEAPGVGASNEHRPGTVQVD